MNKKVTLYILCTAFLFGTMEVVLKIAGSEMDSLQLTFLRFIFGGIFLIPFAIKERSKISNKLMPGDYLWTLFLGILCIPFSMLFFQLGIMRSNASTAAVLMSISPLFTAVLAYFILKDQISKGKILALLLGLVGIVFMIKPWDMQEGNTPAGAALMLLAAVVFSLYTVTGKIRLEKIGLITQTCLSFILGSMVLLLLMLGLGRPVMEGVLENIWMVLYISVFVTGVGYYSYFMAIKHSDATTASIVFFIKPAVAPVFAVVILHDVLLWNTYLGIFLVLLASFVSLTTGLKWKKARVNIEKINIKKN